MIWKLKSGRKVEIAGIDYARSPEDTFVTRAYYEGTDTEVTDAEYDELNTEFADEIYEAWVARQCGHADALYDQWKDEQCGN